MFRKVSIGIQEGIYGAFLVAGCWSLVARNQQQEASSQNTGGQFEALSSHQLPNASKAEKAFIRRLSHSPGKDASGL